MTRNIGGRSPSGPGSRPTDRAASAGVSAVPASIPNAVLPGDIVQITDESHHWFPCLLVVSELKSFGIQGFAFMPHNDGSGTGEAYIRLNSGAYERVGEAVVLPQSTMERRAEATASGIVAATAGETQSEAARLDERSEQSPTGEAGDAQTPSNGDSQ